MIDKEACKTRKFPKIKKGMDLLDWQNVKEQCINAINTANVTIEANFQMLDVANTKIDLLSR